MSFRKGVVPHLPFAAALSGSILYGTVPFLSIALYKVGVNAESLLVLRYWLGFCMIAPIVGHAYARSRPIAFLPALKIYLAASTIGTAYVLCYFEALHRVPSSIAILIFFTYPTITLVIERVVFKKVVDPLKGTAAILIIAGSGLAIGKFGTFTGTLGVGLTFALLAPFGYCVYLQIASRELTKMTAWTGALLIYFGLGTGFFGVILFSDFRAPVDAHSWLMLGAIVIFGSALPTAAFAYSMPRLGPSAYGIVASSELLTVIGLGVILLGERLSGLQTVGAVLVIFGIVLSRLSLNTRLIARLRPARH